MIMIEAEDYPMKPLVTNITNVLTMVTDVYPMVTDVYPMLAEESSVANPQKVAIIDENIWKMEKDGLATLHLLRNYLIPQYYQ